MSRMNIITEFPCPFPDEQCVPCLLRTMEPEKREGITRLLQQLPQMDTEIIERCLRTIKLMTKGQQALESPYSPYGTLAVTANNVELDYLVSCGLLPVLVDVAEKVEAPFSPDYALDIIALFLASTTDPSHADDLTRNHNLAFRITGLLIGTDISTIRGSALNVLSAVFRTTNAANHLATSDPELLQDLIKVLVANGETPDQILLYELGVLEDEDTSEGDQIAVDGAKKMNLVEDAFYQLDILNIELEDAPRYSPRWAEILRDRATTAFSYLVKSLCLSETGEPALPAVQLLLSQPDVLEFLFESVTGKLPQAYPDTDRPLEAAVCLAALCGAGNQIQATLVSARAVQVLSECLTYLIAERDQDVVDLFLDLERFCPAEMAMLHLPENADWAIRNRCLQLTALTYALATLCRSEAFASVSAADSAVTKKARAVLRSVVQLGLYAEPPEAGSCSPEEASVKSTQLSRIFLAKGKLAGTHYVTLLYCPPAVDSACLGLARLNASNSERGLIARLRPEIKSRLEQSRQMGDADFAAGRYRSSKDYYGLASELAEIIGDRDRCCLCLTNKAECELQLGQWRTARDTALKSLGYCSDQHKHYAKTISRRDRAMKHIR